MSYNKFTPKVTSLILTIAVMLLGITATNPPASVSAATPAATITATSTSTPILDCYTISTIINQSVAADGTIAIYGSSPNASGIFLRSTDGTCKQVANNKSADPKISPDGKTILATQQSQLVLIDAKTAQVKSAGSSVDLNEPFDYIWLKNGNYLVLTKHALVRYDTGGNSKKVEGAPEEGIYTPLHVSQTGQILFTGNYSSGPSETVHKHVFVLDAAADKAPTRITVPSNWAPWADFWAGDVNPDGVFAVTANTQGDNVFGIFTFKQGDIWDHAKAPIVHMNVENNPVKWSPDGKILAFVYSYDLYLTTDAPNQQSKLTGWGGVTGDFYWTADSNWIIYRFENKAGDQAYQWLLMMNVNSLALCKLTGPYITLSHNGSTSEATPCDPSVLTGATSVNATATATK